MLLEAPDPLQLTLYAATCATSVCSRNRTTCNDRADLQNMTSDIGANEAKAALVHSRGGVFQPPIAEVENAVVPENVLPARNVRGPVFFSRRELK